jgi:Neuraminidase (sialidase)
MLFIKFYSFQTTTIKSYINTLIAGHKTSIYLAHGGGATNYKSKNKIIPALKRPQNVFLMCSGKELVFDSYNYQTSLETDFLKTIYELFHHCIIQLT